MCVCECVCALSLKQPLEIVLHYLMLNSPTCVYVHLCPTTSLCVHMQSYVCISVKNEYDQNKAFECVSVCGCV